MVGEVKGYLWMQRRLVGMTREEAAEAARGGSNAKAEMVCAVSSIIEYLFTR